MGTLPSPATVPPPPPVATTAPPPSNACSATEKGAGAPPQKDAASTLGSSCASAKGALPTHVVAPVGAEGTLSHHG